MIQSGLLALLGLAHPESFDTVQPCYPHLRSPQPQSQLCLPSCVCVQDTVQIVSLLLACLHISAHREGTPHSQSSPRQKSQGPMSVEGKADNTWNISEL